jgi:CRP-like cAMP-binding protein
LPTTQNYLIQRLPTLARQRLLRLCEPFPMVLADVLCERDVPVQHVYFPTQGFISLVAKIEGHAGIEVGMVGREGMLGMQLVLGVVAAPFHALVQGSGLAWRIRSSDFLEELVQTTALRYVLQQYLYVLMVQMASSAACLRFHQIGERLARWLLMSHDRAHADTFHITHEFLAYMLGVRRVGITTAAGILQGNGLITYHRGELTVLDRSGLEAAACCCYATDQKAYADQLCSTPHRWHRKSALVLQNTTRISI